MNWIAAYIQAVKTNLPRPKSEDLSEELRSLIEEDFERDRGIPPDEAEETVVLEWLEKREHPAVVAARYHDRRSLVNEDNFPLFKLTLRYVLIALLVAYASIAAISAFSTGNYHLSIVDLATKLMHAGLLAFAVVTLIFHFLGERLSAVNILKSWNPKELPNPNQKWEQEAWSSLIGGIVFTLIFLLLINGFLGNIAQTLAGNRFESVEINFAEPVLNLLPAINAVLTTSILLYCFMLFKPCWSSSTLIANLLISLGVAYIAYQLQDVYPFVTFNGNGTDKAQNIEKLLGILNTSFRLALIIVIVVNLFEIARGGWRLYKLGNRRLI